jgi:hypothetical protein
LRRIGLETAVGDEFAIAPEHGVAHGGGCLRRGAIAVAKKEDMRQNKAPKAVVELEAPTIFSMRLPYARGEIVIASGAKQSKAKQSIDREARSPGAAKRPHDFLNGANSFGNRLDRWIALLRSQ